MSLDALLALPQLADAALLWRAAEAEEAGRRVGLAALFREAFASAASELLPAELQLQHRPVLLALLETALGGIQEFQLGDARLRLFSLQIAHRRATAHLALVLEDWPRGEVLEPAVAAAQQPPEEPPQQGAAGAAAQPQPPPPPAPAAFLPGRGHVVFRELGIDCLCASAASAEAYYRLLLRPENCALIPSLGAETAQLVAEKAQWAVRGGARWRAAHPPLAPLPPPLHHTHSPPSLANPHPSCAQREWQAHLRASSALASAQASEPSAAEVQVQREAELRAHPQAPPCRFYAAARRAALTRARLARVRAFAGARRLLPEAWAAQPAPLQAREEQRRAALPGDATPPAQRAEAVLALRDEYRARGLHPKTADEQAEWSVILHHPDSPELEHYA
jgi:hypothetical protein